MGSANQRNNADAVPGAIVKYSRYKQTVNESRKQRREYFSHNSYNKPFKHVQFDRFGANKQKSRQMSNWKKSIRDFDRLAHFSTNFSTVSLVGGYRR